MKFLIALLASVLPLMAQSPFDVSLAQVPYMAASGTIPGIFVDSFAGSDSNAGTSNAPFATAFKVNQVLGGSATTNIYFKRGGKYGRFQIPTNSTVDAYGTANYAPDIYGGVTNSKPVFSGALHITNSTITKTGGRTIVYQATLSPQTYFPTFPFTNTYSSIITSNVLMLWQNGLRVGKRWSENAGAGGVASVDAGAGRFYYDTSTKIIYFSTLDGSDPTSTGFFEASFDTLGIYGGDNVTLKNVIAEKQYSHSSGGGEGMAINITASGLVDKCVGRGNYDHIMGVGNSIPASTLTFRNCYASDVDTNISSTVFIAYKDSGSSVVVFTNCLASNPFNDPDVSAVGYYCHDNGGDVNVAGQWINCVAVNLNTGFQDNAGRVTAINGNTAYNCLVGMTLETVLTVNNFTNFYAPKTSGGRGIYLASGITNTFLGCKFIFTNDSTGIAFGSATALAKITNSIFASTTSRRGFGIGGASGSPPPYVGWSNVFSYVTMAYLNGTWTGGSGNYNTYYNLQYIGDLECCGNPSPQYWAGSNLSGWQSAFSGVDVNSVTTDPGYAAGFYTYTVVDPTGGDAN